jgi:hypothetical protein
MVEAILIDYGGLQMSSITRREDEELTTKRMQIC